jgi:hypothetical protein
MLSFELRQTIDGFALSGGQLEAPLSYSEEEAATRLVGFLSQQQGSELRIYSESGELKATQCREPAIPLDSNSMGAGLSGTSALGN